MDGKPGKLLRQPLCQQLHTGCFTLGVAQHDQRLVAPLCSGILYILRSLPFRPFTGNDQIEAVLFEQGDRHWTSTSIADQNAHPGAGSGKIARNTHVRDLQLPLHNLRGVFGRHGRNSQ
ncbi:hypothetical protein D3C86_1710830 [compost metagenome]